MSSSSEQWRTISGGAHDSGRSSVINHTILRFRPIAPKPATCPEGSPDYNYNSNNNKNGKGMVIRKKRKYVRARRNSGGEDGSNRSSRNDGVSGEVEDPKRATTLFQPWPGLSRPMESDRTVVVVEVTIECVTSTKGESDHRAVQGWVMGLEADTCPGFVSDGSNSVTWMNEAFKRLARKEANGSGGDEEVVVGLVIKEKFPAYYWEFTGHVKLRFYYCHHHASGVRGNDKVYSRVLPFDLWRIDGGGFAWRLDVDSALTLGRT